MAIAPLILGERLYPTRDNCSWADPQDADAFSPVTEEVFHHRLSQERQRSERTQRRTLLLRIYQRSGRPFETDTVWKLRVAIAESARAGDTAGWYQQGVSIGMILVDMPSENSDWWASAIVGRLTDSFRQHLDGHQIGSLSIVSSFADRSGSPEPDAGAKARNSDNIRLPYREIGAGDAGRYSDQGGASFVASDSAIRELVGSTEDGKTGTKKPASLGLLCNGLLGLARDALRRGLGATFAAVGR